MAACQVCISGISVFTLEHPIAASSKNFSTDESSTFDESTRAAGIDSSDTEIDNGPKSRKAPVFSYFVIKRDWKSYSPWAIICSKSTIKTL